VDRANHHTNPESRRGSVLAGLDDSLIDFLRVVKLSADSLKIFVTVTFMVSVSCYIVAVVTLRVLGSEMPWIQRLTFHNWTVCGLLMLVMMLVPLAKLDTKIRETKNDLLLRRELWRDSDPGIASVARDMVTRVELVNHETRLFSTIPVTSATLNMLIVVVPHLIDYVIAPSRLRS